MTLDANDPNRHPEAPPRSGSYEGLDAARRRVQSVQSLLRAAGTPEPGIFHATYPLPRSTMPDERLPGSSPVLGLPFEELVWKKTDTEPAVVFRRFKVRIHGHDD